MFCEKTKEFLSGKGVQFRERNIVEDPTALEELKRYGFMTTPVTVIGDQVIVGFDTEKLERALNV